MAVRTHSPRHTRSKSEGTLIDLDESPSTTHLFVKENNNLPGISKGQESNLLQDWDLLVFDQPNHTVNQSTNPFWNGLSGSNPFLDDIAKESDDNVVKPSSALNENALVFENPRTAESIGSSADELDVDNLIYIGRPFAKQHGRWKSASDILDFSNKEDVPQNNRPLSEFIAPNLESFQNDREAYKAAWLNHRQLTRSCLDLDMGLLKLDHQGIVVRLLQDVVMLSAAVELGVRWRELAEKLAKLSKHQIDAYEAPHRTRSGEVGQETMWKPAHDFLYTWSIKFGDGYQDVLQELQNALDKMRSPITRHWRHLTGVLILVNCLEILRASAFPRHEEE
ncbi:metastasis-associated in colon cancer protein 1 isoform X2 [Hemitrygon akajei]|uniref:metastasis-associated in colon cancer protein 1 isoform X2 n=1 Tax=Hemitrygon akajei TaxID=2704970 RepID=UPI003BFA1614